MREKQHADTVSFAILVFVSTWNEYFWPLLLTQSAENMWCRMLRADRHTGWMRQALHIRQG